MQFRARAHLEDGDPGVANVVEIDGAVVRVGVTRAADVVVLVPVDAGVVAGAAQALSLRLPVRLPAQRALHTQLTAAGDVRALLHAVVSARGADKRVLVTLLCLVVGPQESEVVVPGGQVARWGGTGTEKGKGEVRERQTQRGRVRKREWGIQRHSEKDIDRKIDTE